MSTTIKQRRGTKNRASGENGAGSPGDSEFDPGSLEAELSAIGRSATDRAWAKVPADYFANLDHYRCGAPKKK